ncbi:hypothetical protein D3875_04095 [Deinococcus cavernae]|uniref:Phage tail tape measure protein domain-containing protein n=1 Tax=Deinococcus cavernae TaxID=2320857 RepID=A0A418VEH0_9DEIO|nr:phage tail tape measure protein [Deinococcus cavernae]RJF74468.1 hypothetical protein D3875_04095 [Deinococcus cavernae]
MATLQDQYVLDVNQAITQLGRVDAELVKITAARRINLNTAGITLALSQLKTLQSQLGGLSGRTPRVINVRVNTGNLSGTPRALADVERSVIRLTQASAMNLGMTQRLSGVFGMIPGPLGLYASAASTVTGALTGLNSAQKLNTVGAFALAGGLVAVGAAAATLASHGVKQLGEFQAAVNTLNAQGDGLGNGFDERIRALQAAGGRTAQQFNRAELATGAADLTKQGLEEADAMKVLATSYKLAGAEGQKLTESSTLLLANLRQFGFDGPKAAAEAAHFGDVLAKGSLQAASGAKELQEGLSVVGPLAAKANFSLEETVGFLVAMDNAGLKASTVGANAYRAVLMALASPSGPARAEIESLGVALENLDGSARPVRDVLMDLRKAAGVSGVGYDDATKAALRTADSVESAATIFRSRGVVGFLNMVDATDKYIDGLNNSQGALDQYADALTEGPLKAQERLRKSVDDLALTFAQTFGPKLSTSLDTVTQTFRDLDELTRRPEAVKAYLDAIATGIGGVTLALTLNTLASKGALGAGGFSAFVAMLQGTVAGGVLVKAATQLKTLALVSSVAFRVNGFTGLIATLMAIPAVAGAALTAVTLFAAGAVAANFKIAGDIHNIYDDLEKDAAERQSQLMARVAELRKQGPLGNLKAKQLLTISLRYEYDNTPEQNAALDAKLLKIKQEIEAQQQADAARLAASKGKKQDATATAEQTAAYEGLIQKLTDLKGKFSDSGSTAFEKNLQDLRKSVADLNLEIDKMLNKGEITPAQAIAAKKQVQSSKPQLVQGIIDRQLDADAETRVKHERAVQDLLTGLTKDGRIKRQQELQRQLDDSKKIYDEEIAAALRNAKAAPTSASRRDFQNQAGELQRLQAAEEKAIREKANQDLEEIDRQRLTNVLEAQQREVSAQASGAGARIKLIESERDHELELAGDNAQAKLAIEQRYGPMILQLQRQQAVLSGQAQRSQLQATLEQQLKDAESAGNRRGELERAARATYLADLRTLELGEEATLNEQKLAQDKRVQAERLTIYKKGLDDRLAHLKDFTGKEIAAMEATLTAERAKAVASGDGGRVAAIDDALEKVSDVKYENLKDFREELTSAGKEASSLQTQLREVAQTPLERAIKSATSPFDGVSEKARKQLDDLRKAYGKVASPTPEQTADFQRQQANLTGILVESTASRAQARRDAEVKYQQEVNDRQQDAFLKQAKRELDLGQITQDEYERRLRLDLDYWTRRRDNAQRAGNTEGADQADGKVQAVQSELVRLEGERRQLAKDTAAFSREQLQSNLEQARTEGERVIALNALNASDRERVAALDSEISKLEKEGGHEKDILALKRERAGVQRELTTRAQEELDHSKALRQSVLDRVDAENKLAEKQARTDDDLAVVRARNLLNLYSRVSEIDTQIGSARSDEERNRLTGERLGLTGQILDLENTIADAPLEIARRQLDVLRETVQARLQLAGLADDEIAVAQSGVEIATRELEIAQQAVEAARTQADQERAGAALETAQANLSKANAQLAQAPVVAAERQLNIYRQLAQARLILAGLGDDEVRAAQLAVNLAERQVKLAEDRVAAGGTSVEREKAQAELTTAQAELVKARAAEARAPIEQQERLLGLLRSQVEERRVLAGLDGDPAAEAQARLQFAQADLQLARERAEVASTQVEREQAASDISSRNTEVERARKAVITAQLAERDKLLARIKEEATAQATLTGLNRDAVASKQLELEFTQLDRRETEQRLQNAQQLQLSSQEVTDLQLKRSGLAAQEVKQQQELARALFDQVRAAADLAEATTRSGLARSQFFDDGVALAKVDLAATRQKLTLNAQELAQADELGVSATERLNLQKERQALLGQEAEGVRKVADAERERLVFTRALRDTLRGLRDVAVNQSEATALQRFLEGSAAALRKLREAEQDAGPFLQRLASGEPLAFHEADQGKQRVEALTGAITDYRSKLVAVADAYDQQVSGIEGVVQATLRLNEISGTVQATAFSVQVAESQRQQALAETNRLLGNQQATYAQVSAAAGRLAEAESQRLTVERNLLNNLATRGQKGDADALEELRQRLGSLGYAGDEVTDMLRRVRKEGVSALSDVQLRISQQAEDRLAQLRERALRGLSDVGRLRAEAFRTCLEAAQAFEEYTVLNDAAKLADAGFTDLEAQQVAAVSRQEQLKALIGKTSFLQEGAINRQQARAALDAENAALIEQVRLRRGIQDASQVTRDDVAQQRSINLAVEQARAVEVALAPLRTKLETERTIAVAQAVQEELGKLKVPSLDDQMRRVGVSAGEQLRLAIEQQLSRPIPVQLSTSGLSSGGQSRQSIQKSQTVNKTFHNSFNITTQPGQDVNVPELAREVATHLNQQSEVYGECP